MLLHYKRDKQSHQYHRFRYHCKEKPPHACQHMRIMSLLARNGIIFRPLQVSDADDFMAYVGDGEVCRYCRMETMRLREEALKYLQEVAIPHPWFRAICVQGRAVGFVYVLAGDPAGSFRHNAGITYAPSSHYSGRGIVTQALKMVLSCVFGEFPNLVRLEAKVDGRNKASLRVLEKAGFVHEGVLRKIFYREGDIIYLHVYSFSSSDPLPK
ncbi:hypothetical protein ACLOJK_025024 [Asimina triloba]